MPAKIVPTRGNMVRLARSLELARKGHDLLEQKRQVLMMELTATIAKAIVIWLMIRATLSSTSCSSALKTTTPTYTPSNVTGAA